MPTCHRGTVAPSSFYLIDIKSIYRHQGNLTNMFLYADEMKTTKGHRIRKWGRIACPSLRCSFAPSGEEEFIKNDIHKNCHLWFRNCYCLLFAHRNRI